MNNIKLIYGDETFLVEEKVNEILDQQPDIEKEYFTGDFVLYYGSGRHVND